MSATDKISALARQVAIDQIAQDIAVNQKIGGLELLSTTEKGSLVGAINEVAKNSGADLSDYYTKSEIDSKIEWITGEDYGGNSYTYTSNAVTPAGVPISLPAGVVYKVGAHHLRISLDGLILDEQGEVGEVGSWSNQLSFDFPIPANSRLCVWVSPFGINKRVEEKVDEHTNKIAANRTKIEAQQKEINALKAAAEGKLFYYEQDDTVAYRKDVPNNTLVSAVNGFGGRSVVMNQLAVAANATAPQQWRGGGGGEVTVFPDGSAELLAYSVWGHASLVLPVDIPEGHKVYLSIWARSDAEEGLTRFWAGGMGDWGPSLHIGNSASGRRVSGVRTINVQTKYAYIGDGRTADRTPTQFRDPQVVDLTQMFGAGNEPTAEEFEAMFPDYIPYTEPRVVSAGVDVVKAIGHNLLSDAEIPDSVKNLEGYGWSAGSVCNEVDFVNKKFIKRVGCVDMGTLGWVACNVGTANERVLEANLGHLSGTKNVLCDKFITSTWNDVFYHSSDNIIATNETTYIGFWCSAWAGKSNSEIRSLLSGSFLYYELATPEEIDISDLLEGFDPLLEVEDGGTITFEQKDNLRLSIPSSVKHMIKVAS